MRFFTGKGKRAGRVSLLLVLAFSCRSARTVLAQEPAAVPIPQAAEPVGQSPAPKPAAPDAGGKIPGAGDKSGAAKPADKSSGDKSSDEGTASAITLGPGDLVEVSVYGVPELATKARVSNDGDLYLPLIDYVHVAGLSLEEAQQVIEKRLDDGGFVRNPHVAIFVDDYSSQGVTLLGEVGRPGIYPIIGERHLFDLFSAAGGLNERASRTVSLTRRSDPDKPRIIHLARNMTDAPETNVEVRPGDTIEVQRAPIVYVVGDVGRPSGLLVDNGSLSVMQAVALAGGPNRTAALNKTRIIRKSDGPNGMTEMTVPLKQMLRAKAPDIPLEANDILFIPVSGSKIAAQRGIETAVALTTTVGIYAIHP
jgi:polysaccharide export outer membrane protein